MTNYERFMKALLRKGEPDRVPLWELIVNEPTLSAWGAKSLEEFVEMEDLDGITVFEDMKLEPMGRAEQKELFWRGRTILTGTREIVRDEWGIVWGITDFGIPYPIDGPIKEPADLKTYNPPDPDANHRLQSLREAVKRFKGKRAIVFLTHDGFEFPHYLRGGMENLLLDYYENPRLAHELAEMVIDYKVRLMRRAIREGADVVVSGDDYANQHGTVMSPQHFREFVLPYLNRSINASHDEGVPFIKHTDGNIWAILDDVVQAGIDALDPIEPAAGMDIGKVKAKYGDRIAVIGNVDCSFVLTYGTVEEVEEAVKETIAKASPSGGHILASSNSIHPAVNPENYKAMVEATRKYGRYPIDPELVAQYRNRNYITKYLKAA
ncbi:MAG: uroporphyrinogen decarboxylase family protein [Armatimonadetes bacterium]|nr:uroporphyrinogen decarboxylase family protein [Armatimonadota bacterium]MDW8028638.1 uroporphyrinogen decarboxylase family protein [Armatimonadota bacterium]